MQPAVDNIVALYHKRILGRHCGIHPENCGIHPENLTLNISLQGYSESKLENPMGFEKALTGPAASAQEAFMAKNFQLSMGCLKTIPPHDVEYLPVTCSHTFAALNIIEAGSECRGPHENISTEGWIDQQRTLTLCPSWKTYERRHPLHGFPAGIGGIMF